MEPWGTPHVSSITVVTPMDCWLNVWCIWHTKVETLQEFLSRHRIGWIIQDFRDMCVSCSWTFRLETKKPWCQIPSRKKKAVMFTTVTINAYRDQINAVFSQVCEIFKVLTLNETNCDWLCDMSVKQPHGQALANESYHRFQAFCCQSEGLAMR